MIFVAVREGAADSACDVVVGLLVPRVLGKDTRQARIDDVLEQLSADLGSPYGLEDSSIVLAGRERQVVHLDTHLAMREVGIEHFVARRLGLRRLGLRIGQLVLVAVVRELVTKRERAVLDLGLDGPKLQPRATQVCFRRRALDGGPVSLALVDQRELDAVRALRVDAAADRLSTHR